MKIYAVIFLQRQRAFVYRCVCRCVLALTLAFVAALVPAETTAQPLSAVSDDIAAKEAPFIGLFARGAGNLHSASFPSGFGGAPAATCCPPFRDGFGWGWSVGAMGNITIRDSALAESRFPFLRDAFSSGRLRLDARFEWTNHAGNFTARADTLLALPGGQSARTAAVEHRLEAELFSLAGAAHLQYRIAEGLHLLAGLRLGVLYSHRYSQFRRWDDPAGLARWQNGAANDTVALDGVIPTVQALNIDASAVIGAQWEIPLSSALSLRPEIFYSHPLTAIVPNRSWTHYRLHAGAALTLTLPKFDAQKNAPKNDDDARLKATTPLALTGDAADSSAILPQRDAALTQAQTAGRQKQTPYALAAFLPESALQGAQFIEDEALGLEAFSRDTMGREIKAAQIRVEEFASRQLFPLLMYVFFDQNSDALPARYRRLRSQETESFAERAIGNFETLDIYAHILNVVGKRLRERPASSIALVGCLGAVGDSHGSEESTPLLARRRAEEVKSYLTETWGIAPERIRIQERGLPAEFSRASDERAKALMLDVAENRRVEIYSDDWEIIEPVLSADTLRLLSYSRLSFRPRFTNQSAADGNAGDGVLRDADSSQTWALQIWQDKRLLREIRGKGSPFDADSEGVSWSIAAKEVPKSPSPLYFALLLTTLNDNGEEERRFAAFDSLPVEYISVRQKRLQRQKDLTIDRFRLIGFDYGKTEATVRHKRIIADFIRPLVQANSVVRVTGHTDAIGNAAINKRLSFLRAQAISREINAGISVVEGLGAERAIYDNETPEGRLYSRTVDVYIETPVEPEER